MAITRVSPGMYSDGRRTVRATTSAQAAQLLGGSSTSPTAPKPATPAAPAAPATNMPSMSQAQYQAELNSLNEQVSKGWITQGQADAQSALSKQKTQYGSGIKLDTPSDLMNTSLQFGQDQAVKGNVLTNPNQVNPFASQKVTYDPLTGQPTVNTQLSEGNQNIVGGYQGAAGKANIALGNVLGDGIFTGNPNNSALTDAVFKQLTQGVDQRKAKDLEQLSQTLANRGIPVGSELYNSQMKELTDNYNDVYSNAQYQAVQQGNNFGLQAAGQLAGIGRGGYFDANLQPFQAQPYNQVDVNSVFNTVTGANLTDKDLANKLAIARLGYGGRGGGGGSGRGTNNPSDQFPNPILTGGVG